MVLTQETKAALIAFAQHHLCFVVGLDAFDTRGFVERLSRADLRDDMEFLETFPEVLGLNSCTCRCHEWQEMVQ